MGLIDNADGAVTEVRKVISTNAENIDGAMRNLPPLTADARRVMRDAAAITGGLTRGRGTIGQLIVDQEIYDDLKEMLRNLKRHPWKILWRE